MPLNPGTRVGPYEILSRIGAGGMGEVFRARDTRLGRTVAVKALPAQFAQNAQLKLRLQREAKTISSLAHPHICALYDVGEEGGVDFLVMEYLEGETLAERLSRGALPLEEALRIATQIAQALDAAHREGIVHRDLKPGNIILTKSGAKLLDFGLARTTADTSPILPDAPTMHANEPLTAEGTIVGTFQYMAPEQLEGLPADARTDIFAFGAVLYELLTGKRAFDGRTKTSLIAAIVAGSPQPISELRPVTPPQLDHVVQRCLEKDPDARWQSAHDLRLELEWIAKSGTTPAQRTKSRNAAWPWILATLALIAAALAAMVAFRNKPAAQTTPLHAHILAPRGSAFTDMVQGLSVSPDGKWVTFTVKNDDRLWLRAVDSLEAKPIDGTKGGFFPFWSPDSRWIAFFADAKLKKVSLGGAPPTVLCAVTRGRPGAWNKDGVILFSPDSTTPLYRVSADGGPAEPLTALAKDPPETTHRWPIFLPDGKRFLYLAGYHYGDVENATNAVYLSSLDDPKQRTLVLRARSNVVYTRGHLLYVKAAQLVAQPFDADSAKLTGEPFRVSDRVDYDAGFFRGVFTASDEGTVFYRAAQAPPDAQLAWLTKSTLGAPMGPPLPYERIRITRDQRKVVAQMVDRDTGLNDLWVTELDGFRQSRLTSTKTKSEWGAIFSPDGKRVLFSRGSGFGPDGDLYLVAADGTSEEELVLDQNDATPTDWSPDGRAVLFDHVGSPGSRDGDDVMLLPMEPRGKPSVFAGGPGDQNSATFSPDGRWVVYLSNESGVFLPYAASFPGGASRFQVTSQMTIGMAWVDDGIAILTRKGGYVIPVTDQNGRLTFGQEQKAFDFDPRIINGDMRSSSRVLTVVRVEDPYEDVITVTTQWATPPSR